MVDLLNIDHRMNESLGYPNKKDAHLCYKGVKLCYCNRPMSTRAKILFSFKILSIFLTAILNIL